MGSAARTTSRRADTGRLLLTMPRGYPRSSSRRGVKYGPPNRRALRRALLDDLRADSKATALAKRRQQYGLQRTKSLLPRPQTIDVKKPSVRTKLRYHELRDIGNNGPYNARVLVYKLNSVYDPSPEVFTTTGTTSVGNHQPEGYDWLASHYRQYRVHSVFYTIKFYTSAHKGFRYFVCAQPSNDTPITSTSQMDALIEGVGRTNQARWGMIFARDSPQGMMVARGKIDIARLEGDFVGRAEADAYAAAVGADPLKVPHIRIFTQVVESTDEIATGDLYAEIDMVYDVEFFEKKTSVIVD